MTIESKHLRQHPTSIMEAYLRGEQLTGDQLVLLREQEALAKRARAVSEHEDFDDRGGAGAWSPAKHARWLKRQQEKDSAFETAVDHYGKGHTAHSFNRVSGPAVQTAAVHKTAKTAPKAKPHKPAAAHPALHTA